MEPPIQLPRRIPGPVKLPEPPPPPSFPVTGVGNIAKAISNVMKEVGTIEKGGFNKFHNYAYARMEDLLVAITPLIGKNGLAIIQNEVEKSLVETRCTVTYEFSIFHESGEVWPERPRFTGMSTARDSKGGLDDKAIAKCHTAARKYFLLALFQVPAGDFDDNDLAPPSPQPPRKPVPGPPAKAPVAAPPSVEEESNIPHRIVAKGPEAWAEKYIQCLGKAQSPEDLTAWDQLNATGLNNLNNNYPDIYSRIYAANESRLRALTFKREPIDPETGEIESDDPGPTLMPDPREDAVAAVQWVAQNLVDFKTYQAAEIFWNSLVAPHEEKFDQLDWDLLLAEWKRTEARLAGT